MLAEEPGNEAEERSLIKAWTKGIGHGGKFVHLQEINLWYGYGREISTQSSWSRWFCSKKDKWYWRRISHNPTEGHSIGDFFGYF
jgi:hypothetical protein